MEKEIYLEPDFEILLLEKVNGITLSGDPWEHEVDPSTGGKSEPWSNL